MEKALSSASNLVKLLPSGTVLAFQALTPTFSNRGACHTPNRYLTAALIHVCALACALLSFTDTLRGRDGKLYYGVATLSGFRLFNYDDDAAVVSGGDGAGPTMLVAEEELRRHRVRPLDCVHAVFSVVMFLTVAFSDSDVVNCFFPEAGENARQLLINLPLGAGFMAGVVFIVFPTTRKGIGYTKVSPTTNTSATTHLQIYTIVEDGIADI
ncbi:protein DMP3-like [Curcuma longa]|uniref:protein DMP3-like n=1 Tax=Curcuma longa TaxID=136217 RepID=UPI003D9E8CA7